MHCEKVMSVNLSTYLCIYSPKPMKGILKTFGTGVKNCHETFICFNINQL